MATTFDVFFQGLLAGTRTSNVDYRFAVVCSIPGHAPVAQMYAKTMDQARKQAKSFVRPQFMHIVPVSVGRV